MTDNGMGESRDIKLEVRFKNARLLDAIEERWGGIINKVWATQKHRSVRPVVKTVSEISGVAVQIVGGLLNMTSKAYCKNGRPTSAARTLAESLDMEPRQLFPPALCSRELAPVIGYLSRDRVEEDRTVTRELRHDIAMEITDELDTLLEALTPRQQKVLRMRFGLGVEQRTLKSLGQNLGVSAGRVRQIEAKALRDLRRRVRRSRGLGDILHGILRQLGGQV